MNEQVGTRLKNRRFFLQAMHYNLLTPIAVAINSLWIHCAMNEQVGTPPPCLLVKYSYDGNSSLNGRLKCLPVMGVAQQAHVVPTQFAKNPRKPNWTKLKHWGCQWKYEGAQKKRSECQIERNAIKKLVYTNVKSTRERLDCLLWQSVDHESREG